MSYDRGVSLRAAILGFLAIEPTTGYTLKQRFDGSVGSFWTATQSQIYRELYESLGRSQAELLHRLKRIHAGRTGGPS